MESALRVWVKELTLPGLLALGYFGSYARGDYGVGSDLDLVVVVESSPHPFVERAAYLPLERLPVPAEALVYTKEEWRRLLEKDTRFSRVLKAETRWLVGPP